MPSFDFALLNQGYKLHHADWNFGPICSGFSRIYWVDKGCASVIINGRQHGLTPGHLYLIPTLLTHYDRNDTDFGHYYVHFLDRTKKILEYYERYALPFQVDAVHADHAIIHRLMELCPSVSLTNSQPSAYDTSITTLEATRRYQSQPLGIRMEVSSLLQQLLSRFFVHARQRHKVDDERIAHTLYVIEKNLSDVPDLDHLAADVSLCKHSFIRLFKRQMGTTPTDYVIRQRIHRAQMQFIDGENSVKRVALSLGYDNISYFSRLFKKVTDVSPKEFIRQNC